MLWRVCVCMGRGGGRGTLAHHYVWQWEFQSGHKCFKAGREGGIPPPPPSLPTPPPKMNPGLSQMCWVRSEVLVVHVHICILWSLMELSTCPAERSLSSAIPPSPLVGPSSQFSAGHCSPQGWPCSPVHWSVNGHLLGTYQLTTLLLHVCTFHSVCPEALSAYALTRWISRERWDDLNTIHPIGNSLKKQKPCTKVKRLVPEPPHKIP